ncbi:hypothetical protein [Marinomonas posidonica]|uniref:Uncharacterized protein n=1 Tax=Marinomonas posidonica (strain CECT 7376 / NCIMB 14433 / IVIA-Po-181) TaxID=491952 RepID=F6CWU2_MARPP|nr:hypothetical protein [Marinomonas posidonica]AEF55504.1 hypothetical protein Mar181_2471 [Marinomonas posidonica IVIA-Po-181]
MMIRDTNLRKTKLWLTSALLFVCCICYAADGQNNQFTLVINGQKTEALPIGYKYIEHNEILLDSTTGKPVGKASELLNPMPMVEKRKNGALYLVDAIDDKGYHLQNYTQTKARHNWVHRWDKLGIGYLSIDDVTLWSLGENEGSEIELLVYNNQKNKIKGRLRDFATLSHTGTKYSIDFLIYEIDGDWLKVGDDAWFKYDKRFTSISYWQDSLVGTPEDEGWPGYSILNQPLLTKDASGQYSQSKTRVTTEGKFIYLLENDGNYGYVMATDKPIPTCGDKKIPLKVDKGWIRTFDDNKTPILHIEGMIC